MDVVGLLATVVGALAAVVAVGVAIWQGWLTVQQRGLKDGLEAQAQAETARAIRAVASDQLGDGSGLRIDIREAGAGIAGAVDRFYTQALVLAYGWFVASVLAAAVGLAVIVWEVIQASSRPDLEAGLKAATGLLVEAVAALFYRQANATRKHAGDLLTSTQGDRRAETARQILSTIEDVERREEIAARLALHLAGAAPASSKRRSAGQSRGVRPAAAPGRSRRQEPTAEPDPGSVE